MNEVINIGEIDTEKLESNIAIITKENESLGKYLTLMYNNIIENNVNRIESMEKLVELINQALKLKNTMLQDIIELQNNSVYTYIGMIELLNTRKKSLNEFSKLFKLENNIIRDFINELYEIFTKLQVCIIASFVKNIDFSAEINGENSFQRADMIDYFINSVVSDDIDEINRLISFFNKIEIKNKDEKDKLEYFLTLPQYHIKQIPLWEIIANNLDMTSIIGDKKDREPLVKSNNESKKEYITFKDLERGDLTKIFRCIPDNEKIRIMKEWLKFKKNKNISDNIIDIPNEKEIYTIFSNLIYFKREEYRNFHNPMTSIDFFSRDGVLNTIEVKYREDSIIVTKGNIATELRFGREFLNTLLFIKEIDKIFPESYILSDCMDELIKGENSFGKKILIAMKRISSNNPCEYSNMFEICNNSWNKLETLIKLPEFYVDEKKIMDDLTEKQRINIPSKDIYKYVKDKYKNGDVKEFLKTINVIELRKIEFPKDIREKIEEELCKVEQNHKFNKELYTPTNEEVWMAIATIIYHRCFNENLNEIMFTDKDGASASLKGEIEEKTRIYRYSDFLTEIKLTYTLDNFERDILYRVQTNNCFKAREICFLWLLDILFETDCLTDYINEMLNNENNHEPSDFKSEIYEIVKQIYDKFENKTYLSSNYDRHKMRWESKRQRHYNPSSNNTPNKKQIPMRKEGEGEEPNI